MHPPISCSSGSFCRILGVVSSTPTTIGVTMTLIFHRFFFSSLGRSTYLILVFFDFFLVSTTTPKSARFKFSFLLLINPRLLICGDPFLSQNPEEFDGSHFLRLILGWAYTIPFCSAVKFSFLARFPRNNLSHPLMPLYSF